VSFEVKQGDVLGVIGRNGAGKSTLLSILSRITEPTTGRIELRGRVGALLEVGTGFHPELSGRENILLNGAILGMKRHEIQRKFDEIVAFAEVEKFIDTPVKHYSSGMYMRLAFAVAAHLEPEILLVDEVLAVGDLAFQRKCLGKMGDAAREGRTVLFVSHNTAAVRRLCTSVMILDKGEITFLGDTASGVKKYTQGEQRQQSQFDVARPDGDTPGWAYRLRIEDGDGEPTMAIPIGRPWQVRVYVRAERPIPHFLGGIGFYNSDDIPLRVSWSDPLDLEPGDYEIVFREETVFLTSGRYSITVGLSTHQRSIHYAENCGHLEIADYAEGINLPGTTAAIMNPMITHIRKIEPQLSEEAL
jgi:lipopolysaccharide transport system ATP-binding protein